MSKLFYLVPKNTNCLCPEMNMSTIYIFIYLFFWCGCFEFCLTFQWARVRVLYDNFRLIDLIFIWVNRLIPPVFFLFRDDVHTRYSYLSCVYIFFIYKLCFTFISVNSARSHKIRCEPIRYIINSCFPTYIHIFFLIIKNINMDNVARNLQTFLDDK